MVFKVTIIPRERTPGDFFIHLSGHNILALEHIKTGGFYHPFLYQKKQLDSYFIIAV